MTSAVTNIGYWLAEIIGDNVSDVIDIGGEDMEHRHSSNNSYSYDVTNIEYI